MTGYHDICNRWVDVVLGRTDKNLFGRGQNRIFGEADRIFSYGHHFELARILRTKKDEPRTWLLNGDRFSVTTSRHQTEIRSAIRRKSDLPSVIIPYTALESAGVDLNSVEIVEVTADRWVDTDHVTYEQPDGSKWRKVVHHGYVDLSPEELDAKVAERNESERHQWELRKQWADEGNEVNSHWTKWIEANPEPKVITADDLDRWVRQAWRETGSEMQLFRSGRSNVRINVELLDDGRTKYSWTTSKHWLGESLIRARVRSEGRTRCKACKGTARVSPDPVADLKREDFESDWAFQDAWNLARRKGRCSECNGRGGTPWTRFRWAYFLSGFDHNEPRPVYFFCELPRDAKPTSIAEAYEDLKPTSVKLAEQMGRTVHRQGDIFAIELPGLTKRELTKQGARFEKRGNLLNTNHEATETAYLPNGSTLVRGTLWHNPDFRDPDHRRVTVGKSWHVAVKNRVPIAV